MSKFILVLPQCLPATQNAITAHFRSRAAWWHWSHDVWLLRFREEMTAYALRDEVRNLLPGVGFLVMKFEDQHHEWAAFGPNQWKEWFERCWTKDL